MKPYLIKLPPFFSLLFCLLNLNITAQPYVTGDFCTSALSLDNIPDNMINQYDFQQNSTDAWMSFTAVSSTAEFTIDYNVQAPATIQNISVYTGSCSNPIPVNADIIQTNSGYTIKTDTLIPDSTYWLHIQRIVNINNDCRYCPIPVESFNMRITRGCDYCVGISNTSSTSSGLPSQTYYFNDYCAPGTNISMTDPLDYYIPSITTTMDCPTFCLEECNPLTPLDDIFTGLTTSDIISIVNSSGITIYTIDDVLTDGYCFTFPSPDTYTASVYEGLILLFTTEFVILPSSSSLPSASDLNGNNYDCYDDLYTDILSVTGAFSDANIQIGMIPYAPGDLMDLGDYLSLYNGALCPGTYDIVISGHDHCGNFSSDIGQITIIPQTVTFSYTQNCNEINFIPSYGCESAIANIDWNFGDMTSDNALYPAPHLYPAPGNYDVYLNYITECAESGQSTQTITIPAPEISIDYTNICENFQFSTTISCQNMISQIDWNFGDGNTISFIGGVDVLDATVSNTYPSPGNYTVIFTYYYLDGTSASITQNITVPDLIIPIIHGPSTSCSTGCLEYTIGPSVFGSTATITPAGAATVSQTSSNTYCVTVTDYTETLTLTIPYTDINGCMGVASYTIDSCCGEAPVPATQNDVVCLNETITYSLPTGTVISNIYIFTLMWNTTISNTTSNTFDVTFLSTGGGSIVVEYTYNDGLCEGVITFNIDVMPTPVLTFDPVYPVCITDEAFPLGATPTGGTYTCATCPSGTLYNISAGTTVFDPNASGTGVFPVTYTFIDPFCGTSYSITQDIIVNNGNWNITTNASTQQDEGYDIITDAEGNIYIVGTFQQSVTFPSAISVTIPNLPLTTSQGAAYVVKYSECGELVWINFDSDDNIGFSKGTAITMDENKGFVFISGIGMGDVTFQSIPASQGVASTPGATFSMTGSSMYIAKFDMTTGEYIDFFTNNFPASTTDHQVTGLDIHSIPGTSKLFYTGSYNTPASAKHSAFVGRIDRTVTAYTPIWDRLSSIQSDAVSLDIAFNRNENRVYITGEFNRIISFNPGPFTTNYNAISDAFFAAFNANTGVENMLRAGGTAPGESGTGTGVDVDVSGKTYLTGHFSSDVLNLYNYNPADFISGLPGVQRGFVLKISGAVHLWNKEIKNDANVMPTGIFVNPSSAPSFSKVFITGAFDNNNITIPALAGSDGFFLSTSGLPKSFTYCMSQGTGAYQWFNTSIDFTAGSVHNPARITASVSHAYTTGFYSGEYNYNPTAISATPPASGPLFSGPNHNTFIVRNDIFNGEYRSEEETTEEQSFESESGEITIYPNPNNGLFTINLNKVQVENSNIEITDINGKVIYSENNNTEKTKTIDLSHLSPGMYFVKVSDEVSNYYKKIIKQ